MSDDRPEKVHGCARYEWERIVRRVRMPGPTKAVALTLATYANQDGTSIYPGNERLVAVSCYSDKTVRVGLEWLRSGYLVERVREGSRGGRRAFADEYRLTIPSDLLTRHELLPPDESPVAPTGDLAEKDSDHRYLLPGSPVAETGSPVAPTKNTGSSYRTPTHHHPLPEQDQRDESVWDVTTAGGDELLAKLIQIDEEYAARRRA